MHSLSVGTLTIDLSAIQRNWLVVCQRLARPLSVASAVIKADAYGLGAEKVSLSLYDVGCRNFFLATVEEALIVRAILPKDATLYVLGGAQERAEEVFFQNRLIPVLFSMKAITRWQSACRRGQIKAPCAIKINTGMTRLGLDRKEWEDLCSRSDAFADLNPILIMSHLACADEPAHALNQEQLDVFGRAINLFKVRLPKVKFSLANSSGIFLGGDWHFDLVRPGAALYGVNPQPKQRSPVEPVVHLELPILQIRPLSEPAVIGYGATFEAAPPTVAAVVAGGYADGLHRLMGMSGVGMINEKTVPVIGRVSMDSTVFDVTTVFNPASDQPPKSVEVLNKILTIDLVSQRNNALGYEVLTSLAGKRYQRRYILDGRPVK